MFGFALFYFFVIAVERFGLERLLNLKSKEQLMNEEIKPLQQKLNALQKESDVLKSVKVATVGGHRVVGGAVDRERREVGRLVVRLEPIGLPIRAGGRRRRRARPRRPVR